MREISIGTLVSKSVDRTKLILFSPFSLKKWLMLLLIASLAGALGGGNGNGPGGGGNRAPEKAAQKEPISAEQKLQEDASGSARSERTPAVIKEEQGLAGIVNEPSKGPSGFLLAAIIIPIALLIVGLILFFAWVGARFKFIWFESIVKNDASVREPFDRYRGEGDSLFRFFIVIIAAAICFFGLLAVWAFAVGSASGIFQAQGEPDIGKIVGLFAAPIVLGVAGILLLTVVSVFVDDFIVTIMAIDRSTLKPAWRKFVEIARENKKEFLLYLLVIMGLGIASGMIALIAALLCIAAILLSGAAIFGLPYLILGALLKAKVIYIIFAVIVGIPFALAAVILLMCVNVPFAVFFRSFSLYFLSSLNVGYTPLPLEDEGPGV